MNFQRERKKKSSCLIENELKGDLDSQKASAYLCGGSLVSTHDFTSVFSLTVLLSLSIDYWVDLYIGCGYWRPHIRLLVICS